MMRLLLTLISTPLDAHVLTPAYEEGKGLADSVKEQIHRELGSSDIRSFVEEVQGEGRQPKQRDLESSVASPVSSFLLDVYGERSHFEVDPEKDPLFHTKRGDDLKSVDGDLTIQNTGESTLHQCHEEKLQPVIECEIHKDVRIHTRRVPVILSDSYAFESPHKERGIFTKRHRGRDRVRYWETDESILKDFIFRKTGVPPEKITEYRTELGGSHGDYVTDTGNYKGRGYKPWGKRDWFFKSYRIQYSYQDEKEEKVPEVFTENGCEATEDLAQQGYYRLHSSRCLDNNNPRLYEDIPVSQPCWREHRVYHATKTGKGDCEPLRQRGYEQISSEFNAGIGLQTYRCTKTTPTALSAPGPRPFCLTGDCEDMSDGDDMDFDQAMSQMAVLDELGKQVGQPHIFSGKSHSCKDTKFKHCCFKNSGIAIRVGISQCSSGERDLAAKRGKGTCVYIGSKPIKQALVTIGKRKIFCCFPSKLLRVFQEQGRSQLGLRWGSAKHPQCRGLSLDEIQRIDFEQMDFSEAFDEIQVRLSHINILKAQNQLKQRLRQMQGEME